MSNLGTGVRVIVCDMAPSYGINGLKGTIFKADRFGWWVRLDTEVTIYTRTSTDWIFNDANLGRIAISLEEELKQQAAEKERQKKIEDQKRREMYADRYL